MPNQCSNAYNLCANEKTFISKVFMRLQLPLGQLLREIPHLLMSFESHNNRICKRQDSSSEGLSDLPKNVLQKSVSVQTGTQITSSSDLCTPYLAFLYMVGFLMQMNLCFNN